MLEFIQFGEQFGWNFLFFGFALYELFFPESLHPKGGTRLQTLLRSIPEPIAVILESMAEQINDIDEDAVTEVLDSNGYDTDDFKSGKSPPPPDDD